MVTCPYICTCCLINTHTLTHDGMQCTCADGRERETGIAWCARIASRIGGGAKLRCAWFWYRRDSQNKSKQFYHNVTSSRVHAVALPTHAAPPFSDTSFWRWGVDNTANVFGSSSSSTPNSEHGNPKNEQRCSISELYMFILGFSKTVTQSTLIVHWLPRFFYYGPNNVTRWRPNKP